MARARCASTSATIGGDHGSTASSAITHAARTFVPERPRTRYLVVRQEDVWFIKFDGEEYGPYQSEREAMLFAIDAAHKLGEQGEDTQVLQVDENGEARPVMDLRARPLSAEPITRGSVRIRHRARFEAIGGLQASRVTG